MKSTMYVETSVPEKTQQIISFEFDESDPDLEMIMDRAVDQVWDKAEMGSVISIYDQNPFENQDDPRWCKAHCLISVKKVKEDQLYS